jgi:hypothetical protein
LGDKFRPATSDMVIACTSSTRWFDLDAVREPLGDSPGNRYPRNRDVKSTASPSGHHGRDYDRPPNEVSAGAPPLDWWNIPPGGYSGSHYAVFPPELCVRPIKAMCPAEVCRQCGEPRRRITGEPEYVPSATHRGGIAIADGERVAAGVNQFVGADGSGRASVIRQAPTLGWTDCGHGDYRPGIVLDPFGGSGTTGMVATGHGRDAILIDLDARNADLARERIGMFLDVRHHQDGAA